MAKNFFQYYIGTIVSPGPTLEDLITDDRKLRFSFYSVLITAILYTFVYVFLILGGGQPFKPWLDIPLETYYRYNVFFCAPSMFLGWILSAGVIHTLARIFTSNGGFEQSLAGFGFGIGIASWTTGIHDLLTSFLGGIHVISQRNYEIALNSATIWRTLLWIQMIAYLIWFVILFSTSVKVVYRLSKAKSILLGTFGFFIYQLFFFIFNR